MLEMAAKIEAVGGVDIVPMNPISERVFLAYDAQKNPDGPMYDGWTYVRRMGGREKTDPWKRAAVSDDWHDDQGPDGRRHETDGRKSRDHWKSNGIGGMRYAFD